ncbi:MAG: recombinase family protein [Candidatus Pacebacteria bacterium]|nr:recombinase family protein [Candidatus Paceibacterota bacterium]
MKKEKQTNNNKYFMYCRKSTDTEDKQVQSIPDQIRELKKIAQEYDLEIIEIFQESKSAKDPKRPIFDEMVRRTKQGEANGWIVWKLNRLSRNPIDGGMVSWLLQEGIVKHIQTYGRSYYPEDNVLMMQVELGMANQYVRDLSVDTKRGIRTRAENGWPNGRAPIGFINDLSRSAGDRIWIVDDIRFPLVKQIFELYETGRYSLAQVTDIANNKMGLRTYQRRRQGGQPLSISYVAGHVLKNPVYAGFFHDTVGTRYELHNSMPRVISEKQFWHIQEIMGNKGRTRPSKHKISFAYTGLIKCGECKGSVTAENKYQLICSACKHKFAYRTKECCPKCKISINAMVDPVYLHYTYYHCIKRKNPNCLAKSVHEKSIDEYLAGYFSENIKISPELAQWCQDNLKQLEQKDSQSDIERKKAIEATLKKKETEYKEVVLMKARNMIDDEEFQLIKPTLKAEIERLRQESQLLGHVDQKQLEKAHRAFDLATGIDHVFTHGTPEEKKDMLFEIGSNLTLKDKKASVYNAEPYKAIIQGLLFAKQKNPQFEPENIVDISRRNEVFSDVYTALLPRQDSNLRPID